MYFWLFLLLVVWTVVGLVMFTITIHFWDHKDANWKQILFIIALHGPAAWLIVLIGGAGILIYDALGD